MFGRQCWISVNVALTLVLGATIPPARAAPTPTLLLKYIPPTSHSVNSILESCSDSWSIVSFLFLYCQYPKHTPSPWYARSSSIDIENPPGIRTAALVNRVTRPMHYALCMKSTCALRQWMMVRGHLVARANIPFLCTVFSSLFTRQWPRRGQRFKHQPTFLSHSSRRTPNCHPSTCCRRPEGEACQC